MDAVVDHLDDGVDAAPTTTMLTPTTLEGDAATFSYKSELAAITAVINQMRQHDAELAMLHPSMMLLPPETPSSPPASPADTDMMDNVMPTATLLLTTTFPMITPASAIVVAPDNDDGTHPHDARCQLLSITATFITQAQMLCTRNMLLVELDGLVDKLVDDPTCFATRPPPQLSL